MLNSTRRKVIDSLTIGDLAHIGLRHDIRFHFKFTPRWTGPWRLDRAAGQWVREFGPVPVANNAFLKKTVPLWSELRTGRTRA